MKGNESKNQFLASNFTKNSDFLEKMANTKKCQKVIKKISIVIHKKEIVPKLAPFDDFCPISEFVTKNCFC